MINQQFKALGRKYQVLPNFGICCRELRRLKVTGFRACEHSFCSVIHSTCLHMADSSVFNTIRFDTKKTMFKLGFTHYLTFIYNTVKKSSHYSAFFPARSLLHLNAAIIRVKQHDNCNSLIHGAPFKFEVRSISNLFLDDNDKTPYHYFFYPTPGHQRASSCSRCLCTDGKLIRELISLLTN